jgi:hypothetical protein
MPSRERVTAQLRLRLFSMTMNMKNSSITIKVSEHTAAALEYYQFLYQVKPESVAGSMVEYCCADSFQQGPALIEGFADDALAWEKGWDVWQSYSENPRASALSDLALAKQEMAKEAA